MTVKNICTISFFVILTITAGGAGGKETGLESPPLSPVESMNLLHVQDGFDVELVVCEPLVQDPTAITWAPDGRLWVAEMTDYPLGINGEGEPGGRIRWLRDQDGDGRYDQSQVFAEGLRFPNGVLPWRRGVLVTSAPQILYLEDTDQDGKSDVTHVLFEGFHEGNQQLRVNGLRWGLDNWIHCASGSPRSTFGADSKIRSNKTGQLIELGSRDLRIRPDTGDMEPQSGPTQFGRNRDDWGNWFGNMNSFPLWHYVLQDRYTRRNPYVASIDSRKQLVLPRSPKVYAFKTPQKRYHSFQQSGRFTSACSAMIYRDELLFPRSGEQHAFTCEPFHNLVQHNVVSEDGVSFQAHRDERERGVDFFASKDRWCRPVMVRTGPDGALWIVDMYRYVIEHPQYLTDEGREELKPLYRAGSDRGRIYRIFPKGTTPRPLSPVDQLPTESLVEQLESPNGPVRDIVQQELIERNDEKSIPALRRTFTHGTALARLHALCTLDGLDACTTSLLEQALLDPQAGIRRHAIRLVESFGADQPALRRAAMKLAEDPSAKVRLQLACTLGEWPGEEVGETLGRLAMRDASDPFLAAAILSSINEQNIETVLPAVLDRRSDPSTGVLIGQLLTVSVSLGNRSAVLDALDTIVQPAHKTTLLWQLQTVAGLMDALARQNTSLAQMAMSSGDRGDNILRRVADLRRRARSMALDATARQSDRIIALRMMAREPATRQADLKALGRLLVPQTSQNLQTAIISHLGQLPEKQVATLLLENWSSHGPAVRAAILGVLLTKNEWSQELFKAIETKRVVAADIDPANMQALLLYGNRETRNRTASLLASSRPVDRQQVIQEHADVLKIDGDPTRGADVFKKTCATCHKLDAIGNDIGPSLLSLSDKRPLTLLTSILDPSASVDARFVTYVALTSNGRTYSGILTSETGNSITLTTQENKQHVILRSELEQLRATGRSLMPDGLEQTINKQGFADLIAYLLERFDRQ